MNPLLNVYGSIQAQTGTTGTGDASLDRIATLFDTIITWGASIAAIVAAAALMYGAFIYMPAGASPRQIETGKSAIAHAPIALVVVLVARTLATAVRNAVVGG